MVAAPTPLRETVFVTHAAPEDNEFALWLSAKLAIAGYRVWVDRRRLRGGDDFWDEIDRVLRTEAIKQVVVFSQHIGKPGVKKELAIGDAMRATSSRTFDLWDLWKAIEVPVLAVRGTRSDLLSAATFDRMLAEKPGLVRVELPNRGHAPQLTEPGAIDAIDAFLARLFVKASVTEAGAER